MTTDTEHNITTITVAGDPGSGKTTMAEILRRVFTDAGAVVKCVDNLTPRQERALQKTRFNFNAATVGIQVKNMTKDEVLEWCQQRDPATFGQPKKAKG